MTLALVGSLVLVLAGAALLVVGGTAATAVAMSLLGFAAVIWVSLAFFAVGRSEDRDRAARTAPAVPDPEPEPERAPHPQRGGAAHKEDERRARFRRRP